MSTHSQLWLVNAAELIQGRDRRARERGDTNKHEQCKMFMHIVRIQKYSIGSEGLRQRMDREHSYVKGCLDEKQKREREGTGHIQH